MSRLALACLLRTAEVTKRNERLDVVGHEAQAARTSNTRLGQVTLEFCELRLDAAIRTP